MKRGSTIFLRGAVWFIGLAVMVVCIFILPAAIGSDNTGDYRPILLGMYVTAIPFFIALYQALRLLSFIDKNQAFSQVSIKALKHIKYCAVVIGILFTAGLPYIYFVANKDDAPGVLALGLVIVFASFVMATAVAVLQKLLQNAIDIKSENDLTV